MSKLPQKTAGGGGPSTNKAAAPSRGLTQGVVARSGGSKGKESSAVEDLGTCINKSVRVVLEKDNYICAEEVIRECQKKIGSSLQDEKRIVQHATIQSIREINREVSLLVDAYFHTTPVKIVHECEEYVRTSLKEWMKRYKKRAGNFDAFEDFGVGHFLHNPRVMSIFRYKKANISKIPKVTTEDVISIFLSIISRDSIQDQSSRASQRRGKTISQIIEFPVGLSIGKLVGPKVSTINLLGDITGAKIRVSGDDEFPEDRQIRINGTEEAIAEAQELIIRIRDYGPKSITVQKYQEKFENHLRFHLQEKYGMVSMEALGVMVDAEALFTSLMNHSKLVTTTYEKCAEKYAADLKERLNKQWNMWLDKKEIDSNLMTWLTGEMRTDATRIHADVSKMFSANGSKTFSSMISSVLSSMDIFAFSRCSSDAPDILNDDKNFAVIVRNSEWRQFALKYSRVLPHLSALLRYGKLSKSPSQKEKGLTEMTTDSESLMKMACENLSESLHIPSHVRSIMHRTLMNFNKNISINIKVIGTVPIQTDFFCENSSEKDLILALENLTWKIVVRAKPGLARVHSYSGSSSSNKTLKTEAFTILTLDPSDFTFMTFTTETEEDFLNYLNSVERESQVIFIFENRDEENPVALPMTIIQTCQTLFGVASICESINPKTCVVYYGVCGAHHHLREIEGSSSGQIDIYVVNKKLFQGIIICTHVFFFVFFLQISTIFIRSSWTPRFVLCNDFLSSFGTKVSYSREYIFI